MLGARLFRRKPVFLDIGNVLLNVDYSRAVEQAFEWCDPEKVPDKATLADQVEKDPQLLELEKGSITSDAYFEHFATWTGFQGSKNTFMRFWRTIFEPNLSMVAWMRREVRRRPVYLVSNAGPIHVPWLFRAYPFLSWATDWAISWQLGALKPEDTFYNRALARFQVDASKGIFVDDREENVKAAERFGFRGIHSQDIEQTVQQLNTSLR